MIKQRLSVSETPAGGGRIVGRDINDCVYEINMFDVRRKYFPRETYAVIAVECHVKNCRRASMQSWLCRIEQANVVLGERNGDMLATEPLKDGLVQFSLRLSEMRNLHPRFDRYSDG